jgi:hypothetical protein
MTQVVMKSEGALMQFFAAIPFIVAFAATAVFWRAVKFNAAFHALFQPQFDAIDNHSSSSRRLEMWRFRKVVSQNL